MGRPSRLQLRRGRDALLALQRTGKWRSPSDAEGFKTEVDKNGWRN